MIPAHLVRIARKVMRAAWLGEGIDASPGDMPIRALHSSVMPACVEQLPLMPFSSSSMSAQHDCLTSAGIADSPSSPCMALLQQSGQHERVVSNMTDKRPKERRHEEQDACWLLQNSAPSNCTCMACL